jgi:hypothetical protein
MSRLSLTDWYRYLETQYADDEPEPQPSELVAETPAHDSPAASPSSSEPLSPAAPKEQTPTVAAAQTPAAPAPAESRRDALVSIRVPDFAEFVPLIEQEVGRKPSRCARAARRTCPNACTDRASPCVVGTALRRTAPAQAQGSQQARARNGRAA